MGHGAWGCIYFCPIAAHGRMGRMDFMALVPYCPCHQVSCKCLPGMKKKQHLLGITLCHILCRRAFPPPRLTRTLGSR